MACGPRSNLPPRPVFIAGALEEGDSIARLARTLAPTLYLHRKETFRLERVVAVAHPERPVIAYHLLWGDDAHGAWIPFTKATDQEIVWIGYDPLTGLPTDVWTFWHGDILHADWRGRGPVTVGVQWGKHGSLPGGTRVESLPALRGMPFFWAAGILGVPDLLLGLVERPGPWCFCGSYRDYLRFTRPLPLSGRIDAILQTEYPGRALQAVFGWPYSRKKEWPWT